MFITVTYIITACYVVKYVFSNKCRESYNIWYLYFTKQTVLKPKIMNYTEAKKYLKRAENSGYVANRSGIVMQEGQARWGGNTTGNSYGINIDGDGHDGRLFGCPRIIWDSETAENQFPARDYKRVKK